MRCPTTSGDCSASTRRQASRMPSSRSTMPHAYGASLANTAGAAWMRVHEYSVPWAPSSTHSTSVAQQCGHTSLGGKVLRSQDLHRVVSQRPSRSADQKVWVNSDSRGG